MNWFKENWHKVAIALLIVERLYYYLVAKPALIKWIDTITEWILKISRETGIGVN